MKKFGSTPLFNIPTVNGSALTVDNRQANGGVGITTAGFPRKPKTSKSFSNNLYEKTYRKPSFTPIVPNTGMYRQMNNNILIDVWLDRWIY